MRNCGTNYIRRPSGERYNPKYTIKTTKHPPNVMVWGGISSAGRGPLTVIPTGQKVDSSYYISILKEKLQTHMTILNSSIMQQDSAPCHVSQKTKEWFRRNGISLLDDWPSNSPDLNVIENCWSVIKSRVAAYRPSSRAQLIETIKLVWTTEITPEYCKSLVRSMPQRLKKVIQNKGYPTKY